MALGRHSLTVVWCWKTGRRWPLRLLVVLLVPLVLATLLAGRGGAEPPPRFADGYALLRAHYEASGGLARWQALTGSYQQGRLRVDGLSGSFRQWTRRPLHSRLVEDFGLFCQVQGDDGAVAWFQDANGQVELRLDPASRVRRELARRLDAFEHLDPASTIFHLQLEAPRLLAGRRCLVARLENSLNSDVSWFFFDPASLELVASRTRQPDLEVDSRYDDYRWQDGLRVAFHQVDHIAPRDKRREIWLTRLDWQAPDDAAVFAVPPPATAPLRWPLAAAPCCLPFLAVEGGIYLPVSVCGDRRWWLLDSGAGHSVIDQDYARQLGLLPQGRIAGFGFGGNFALQLASVPGLVLGRSTDPLRVGPQLLVSVAGLARHSYEPQIHGILGYDFLSLFVVQVDYAAQQVCLYPQEASLPQLPWQEAPLLYRMFCLPGCLDDVMAGRFSLDLGAERSSLHHPFSLRHQLLRRPGIEQVSLGLGGLSFERQMRFDRLQLAGQLVERPLLGVALEARGTAGHGELAGNLGGDILRRFDLWLDYRHQRVALLPGGRFTEPPQADPVGLLIGRADNGLPMVSYVAPNGPAAAAGFVAGDAIIAIDGLAIARYAGVRAVRALLGQTGRCLIFDLQRGDQRLQRELCLPALPAAEASAEKKLPPVLENSLLPANL
ncbi:retropepsin-like aspartic protease [Desulfuromonas thiophila]|uniref:retropepsin-like aspartic protease n=1 Tax=Desulfuromonas thiophila TaxID=57664 RepID=UPI0024A7FACC|nr:retropepsin-like aspartic protease [Desulfuromonas thiophila]